LSKTLIPAKSRQIEVMSFYKPLQVLSCDMTEQEAQLSPRDSRDALLKCCPTVVQITRRSPCQPKEYFQQLKGFITA